MEPLPTVRLVEVGGGILHTDRLESAAAAAAASAAPNSTDLWEKTFLDWSALSQVDVMLMSHSGFSWTAAWSGAVPYVRQLVVGDSCTWVDFDQSARLLLNEATYAR